MKNYRFYIGSALLIITCALSYLYLSERISISSISVAISELFENNNLLLFILALILMPINIGIEVVKWKATTQYFYNQSFVQCLRAVLSGICIGFFLPNRTGEFIGKALSLPKIASLKAIAFSVVTSLSQLIVTILFGVFAFILLPPELRLSVSAKFNALADIFILLLAAGLTIIYFNLGRIQFSHRLFNRFANVKEALQSLGSLRKLFLLKIILLSGTRYFIFTTQYILVCMACGINDTPMRLFMIIAIMYVVITVIPTVTLSELPARGSIMVMIYGLVSTQNRMIPDVEANLVLASSIIWIINLFIPALMGSLFIPSFWIFKRKTH